jgi:hypothetical protein
MLLLTIKMIINVFLLKELGKYVIETIVKPNPRKRNLHKLDAMLSLHRL